MKCLTVSGPCLLSCILLAVQMSRDADGETRDRADIKSLRKEAAGRRRRVVVHSDGYPMNSKHRGLFEPTAPPSMFPLLAGTQADACTYSLVHQFPIARLYRSQVAQEWPDGIIHKMYGDGPDGLESYIDLCHRNSFEAFWAMRMNDTHDASDGPHGRMRWNSNRWKQAHPQFLVARRGAPTPYGQWSALDYALPEVREKVFRVLEEVCRNYDIDGLLLDFFRHLPTFKTTVMGGHATTDEKRMLTDLFRRIRRMADDVGAKRGRPILLAVRAPDSLDYAQALGLDIQQWMKEDLIDIWLASGYFRLQEWSRTVSQAHEHGVKVWASMDESRIVQRQDRNSLEIYRGRMMNAWNAGVDAVWLFNFFYTPDDPQFQLLREAGDPQSLHRKDKIYLAEARGRSGAGRYLREGDRYFTRPPTFSPSHPARLTPGETFTIHLLVGDDVAAVDKAGHPVRVVLRVQANPGGGQDELRLRFNHHVLRHERRTGNWVEYNLQPSIVIKGLNKVILSRGLGAQRDPVLHDLQLSVHYGDAEAAEESAAINR